MSAPPCVVGLDIGTSAVKVVGYDLRGVRIAQSERAYPTARRPGAVAEQDPEDWWRAACLALSEVVKQIGSAPMALGLGGQIGTHTLLSDDGAPLMPAMTWQDSRSQASLDEARDALAPDDSDYGDHFLPLGSAWPITRLLYLRHTRPDLVASAHRLCQPKDYVGLHLTGVLASDVSSLRGAVSQESGRPLHVITGLGFAHLLPPALEPTSLLGTVTSAAQAQCGIPAGVPVYVGLNDLNASLLGAGVAGVGDGFDVGGTSEHIGVLTGALVQGDGLVSIPLALSEGGPTFITYGVSSNAGGVLEWARSTFFADQTLSSLSSGLESVVGPTAARGPAEVRVVPYLEGERAPIWDAGASASISGLRSHHSQWDIVHGLLDGVALNLRMILDLIGPSVAPHAIRAVGGTARLRVWNQIKANALATPLLVMEELSAGALGPAMVAAIGSGEYSGPTEAIDAMVRVAEVVEPNPETAHLFDARYDDFRAEVERVAHRPEAAAVATPVGVRTSMPAVAGRERADLV